MIGPARRRVAEARLALMLLTRLPAGTLDEPAPLLADARWAYPLIGVVVGAIGWIAQQGALALGSGPLPSALLAVGAMVLVTGAMHHDGLADFADGIGGGRDRGHCLEIMRDSRIGSYGVLALILALGLTTSGLASIGGGAPPEAFLLAATGSRLAMLVVLDRLPPARSDGLGRGASGPLSPGAWIPGALAAGLLALWIGPAALPALAAMAAVAWLVARIALRRIDGQTGDVLGATQVLAEVACIIALSAAMAHQATL
jgi:adenosylcobinamide-GDP ribazoletransferase